MYLCKIIQPNLAVLAIKMQDIFLFKALVDFFRTVHCTKSKPLIHNKETVLRKQPQTIKLKQVTLLRCNMKEQSNDSIYMEIICNDELKQK